MNAEIKDDPFANDGGGLPLDTGIREFVLILRGGGVETFESCEGGPGHCYPEPTIRFFGNSAEGFRAFAIAKASNLPVTALRRYYSVEDGELVGPHWEMTFRGMLEPASTNSTRFQEIYARLGRGKDYREAFVESEIDIGIPFQIKAMREARDWTQQDLGERSGKRQSVISQLETPGYGKLTLSSLKKLAAAFDVGLMVRFVSFRELAGRAAHLSDTDTKIPSYQTEARVIPPVSREGGGS